MPVPIPSPLIEFILLGPLDDRRQLQDSPILGDVWVEYGRDPSKRQDLLIVPYRTAHPGWVARKINDEVTAGKKDVPTSEQLLPTWEEIAKGIRAESKTDDESPSVAYLQGLVVARLTFWEVLCFVATKTRWWISKWSEPGENKPQGSDADKALPTTEVTETHEAEHYSLTTMTSVAKLMLDDAIVWNNKGPTRDHDSVPSFERFLMLMGLILWARDHEPKDFPSGLDKQMEYILDKAKPEAVAGSLVRLTDKMLADRTRDTPLVWQISLNRRALPAVSKSVPAVKADAAKTLFNVDCSNIGWAVIDSGIDGGHAAFMQDGESRVKKSYDFKEFRRVVSLSNDKQGVRAENLNVLLRQEGLIFTEPIRELSDLIKEADQAVTAVQAERIEADRKLEAAVTAKNAVAGPDSTKEDAALRLARAAVEAVAEKEAAAFKKAADLRNKAENKTKVLIDSADKALEALAEDARERRPLHWELVEKLVEILPATKPQTNHGTHVAGIIGASKVAAAKAPPQENIGDGMCPDIALFDFRVLARDTKETEFAIIAALQFIRYLNDRDNLRTIHGVNLSLSIPHDVRNFACGRTPICDECERLIASGVVVVAAAGNHGYKSFQTADGSYDSYAAFSITDPGNAENVLTVGATHRFWPHTYGISFFSSRGPTGDGRLKPDLVAPGERIRSTFPNDKWGDLDGTSMAAPHVSGAAAMLMARYSELMGQPLRVKRIICESATDLGRERSFQGHGMLDVLRAFQSI